MTQDILRRNNVRIAGAGEQTLLFAHGFGCDQNMWRFVVPEFVSTHRVVTFDYVGHGGSDFAAYDPSRYGSLDGYASDLLDICDALRLSDLILVGHSVSCVIAMLASIRAPELFRKLVLICPSPRYLNDLPAYYGGFEVEELEQLLDLMDRNYMGWAQVLAPTVMQNGERPELAAELEQSFCSTDPVAARDFAKLTFFGDNRADLRQVPVPALILQTSNDAIAPPQVGQFLEQELPRAELVQMQASGHCPHLSHPDEVCTILRRALRG